MTVQLNHTIVPARDKHASAGFIADILGLTVGEETPPFVPVRLSNGVTLDYQTRTDVVPQHYAFLLDDESWDAAYERLLDRGVQTWGDPDHRDPGGVNTRWGGRGVYFPDPDGHNMEIMTAAPDAPR
jgi:catechol 2,3-dioxygenase-like lactoylglutathione lyase family enzyme